MGGRRGGGNGKNINLGNNHNDKVDNDQALELFSKHRANPVSRLQDRHIAGRHERSEPHTTMQHTTQALTQYMWLFTSEPCKQRRPQLLVVFLL